MMTELKGLAFFDLDGTLLNADSKVTPAIADALQQLRENGIMPVIATGRTNLEILEISQDAGVTSFITMNGQHVIHDGEVIYSQTIPSTVCQRFADKAQELGHDIGFYTPDTIKVSSHSEQVKDAYSFIHTGLPSKNVTFYEDLPINMMLVIGDNKDELYQQAFPELTFFRNTPFATDVISHGGSKGTGVKEYVKALNLANLTTYAFGDGPNDIDLFKACDYGIAMGNAVPELKALATYVTTDNIDRGIINALEHLNLI